MGPLCKCHSAESTSLGRKTLGWNSHSTTGWSREVEGGKRAGLEPAMGAFSWSCHQPADLSSLDPSPSSVKELGGPEVLGDMPTIGDPLECLSNTFNSIPATTT